MRGCRCGDEGREGGREGGGSIILCCGQVTGLYSTNVQSY